MNATIAPPPPQSSAPAGHVRVHPYPEPPVRLGRLLVVLTVAIAAFDICFWKIDSLPGLSLGVFFLVLAGCILANREARGWSRRSFVILLLLVGAACQSAIETGFTNTVVLLALIVVLAGDSYYSDIASAWGRWSSEVVALLFAPGRLLWLAARLLEACFAGEGRIGELVRTSLLAVPAIALVLIFGSLLAAGNAVFGSWTGSFFDWLWKTLSAYLDLERIFMWLFVAFLALPLLRPAQVSEHWWKWTENIPRTANVISIQSTAWVSMLILVAMNALFFVANLADALFLWSGRPLPAGVNYHTYVHEGVNTLITTVILSAFVLTGIFQQSREVATRPWLKILGYAWIAQNLILIVSVAEKLRRYIVSFEMTVARLSTLIFLLLVIAGFVCLTIKIARHRSFAWLVGACLVSIFVTFYITQFLNLAGWSADHDAARLAREPSYHLDTDSICKWGPGVWPALRRAHDLAPSDAAINQAFNSLRDGEDFKLTTGQDVSHWREFSLRAWWNRSALDEK